YIAPDSRGVEHYHSLLDRLDPNARTFRDIWQLMVRPEGVYFMGTDALLFYDRDSVYRLDQGGGVFRLFEVGQEVWVSHMEAGLQRLEGRQLSPIPGGTHFQGTPVYGILTRPSGEMLIVSKREGATWVRPDSAGRLLPVPALSVPDELLAFLAAFPVSQTLRLEDGTFAFGSRGGGVALWHPDSARLSYLHQANGLTDDRVLCLMEDREGGLWAGTELGLTRMERVLPMLHWQGENGPLGKIRAIIEYEGRMLVGTSQGLFVGTDAGFVPVPELSEAIWALLPSPRPHEVLIAGAKGVRAWQTNGKVQDLSPGIALSLLRDPTDSQRVWVGTYQRGVGR
ncbi:MAG: hypothetical protein D6722_13130, partial [Bacteroidetes bacterium]